MLDNNFLFKFRFILLLIWDCLSKTSKIISINFEKHIWSVSGSGSCYYQTFQKKNCNCNCVFIQNVIWPKWSKCTWMDPNGPELIHKNQCPRCPMFCKSTLRGIYKAYLSHSFILSSFCHMLTIRVLKPKNFT